MWFNLFIGSEFTPEGETKMAHEITRYEIPVTRRMSQARRNGYYQGQAAKCSCERLDSILWAYNSEDVERANRGRENSIRSHVEEN